MGVVGDKGDELTQRIQELTDRADMLEATNRRRLQAIHSGGLGGTSSTSYVDLGPTLVGVRPGPSGSLLVNLTCFVSYLTPGEVCYMSYRIAGGPTVVAADDSTAFMLDNGFNSDEISINASRESLVTGLVDGTYFLVTTIRSGNGGYVEIADRGISAQPL